jgi:dephospho-CoA kinase
MILAGLTGSIAMGKSTVAAMFAALGAPVFDADEAVRAYYAGEGAAAVEAVFPGVVADGTVDRERLANVALGDPAALERLEALVHPAVADARTRFVEQAGAKGRRLAIVDIPLLFETGADSAVDLVVVVSAPAAVQRARVLRREGMHAAKLDAIMKRQMSDSDKRRLAHFVIDTGGSLERTRAQVRQFMRAIATMGGGRRA